MVKIGILGVGHLGKIHLKCAAMVEQLQVVGFYDPDEAVARKVSETFGVPSFPSMEALFEQVQAVDIVTPTQTHFELAEAALLAGKHVFMEKPATETEAQAEYLENLANEKGLKVQIGHVERFNPALTALDDIKINPMFIEAHRLAQFNPRGTDVSVILDIMIHDLDIVLSLVDSEVSHVSASGVAVVSDSPDIANARIEFENGCVANLTASRMSFKNMRKLRLFQQDAYISMDFLERSTSVVRLFDEPGESGDLLEIDTGKAKKWIKFVQLDPEAHNAIEMELRTFSESVLQDKPVRVGLADARKAIALSGLILKEIEKRNLLIS